MSETLRGLAARAEAAGLPTLAERYIRDATLIEELRPDLKHFPSLPGTEEQLLPTASVIERSGEQTPIETRQPALQAPSVEVTPQDQASQLRDALRPFVQEYQTAEVPTPALIDHTWQNFWRVVGEVVDHRYQVPSCDRTPEELAQLRQQERAALLLPDDIYTPDGLVRLGKAFPLMSSWSTDPAEAVKIQYGTRDGGCIDIEMNPDAPYRTVKGYTEQQLKDNIAENSRQSKRPITGQRLPTCFVGSQFSQLLTREYFDLRTWSRLPGSVYRGRVLSTRFLSDGHAFVDHSWDPQAQLPDLGGRSEGRKA